MAALRLRQSLSLSSALLRRTFPATSAAISHLSSHVLPPITPLPVGGNAANELLPSRGFRSTSFCLSASGSYNNFDHKIDENEILFEGCDYKHWLITMDFKDHDPKPSPEEMVETYVQTCAKVVGSVEEAKKRIYACSTTTYTGFNCEVDEETSKKFEDLPGVVFVLPDSYIDPVNKEYGGDKYINGTIIPRPPPVHYGRQRRYSNQHQPQRGQMRDQQWGSSNDQQGSMQGGSRNFSPQQGPPQQQNYGPPQNFPPQQRSGPPQNFPSQQNYGAPQSFSPQQNYGAPQNFSPRQSYGAPQNFSPRQNLGPQQNFPAQQNLGPQQNFPPQQNLGPPQNFPPQQNLGPPQNFPPQQNLGPPQNFPPQQNFGQHYPLQQGYGPPRQEHRSNPMSMPDRGNPNVERGGFQGTPVSRGGSNPGNNFSGEQSGYSMADQQTGYMQNQRGAPAHNQSHAPPSPPRGSFDLGGGAYGQGPVDSGSYGQRPNSGYGAGNTFQGENRQHSGFPSSNEASDNEQRIQRGQMGTGQGRY